MRLAILALLVVVVALLVAAVAEAFRWWEGLRGTARWAPDAWWRRRSWADVMARVAKHEGPVTVMIDAPRGATIPPGVYDMRGARLRADKVARIRMPLGVHLRDVDSLSGPIWLECEGAPFSWSDVDEIRAIDDQIALLESELQSIPGSNHHAPKRDGIGARIVILRARRRRVAERVRATARFAIVGSKAGDSST